MYLLFPFDLLIQGRGQTHPLVSGATSVNSLNTARNGLGAAGTQTAALGFGGETATVKTAATEEYDGTSWSTTTSLSTARSLLAGAGTQTAGLAFGGFTTVATGATEEWTGAGAAVTKTITVS